ncbi:SDR family NAD(P)-dependent oxidoreductase [Mycobacterium conspicuum]|jgi:NAD(P)-dependent dehydrogenase (short-subunit alcohol dehydrogenase family)|uniref:3-oxoacyl-[acyl-carrier-protein] reductase MabA n=1 Tax=Mycobacterium conspicuum TaxID=44010 RepID=A0A1X1T861_9MYCO|nr:SDR family oxidoreductase [Mycobacterium conspicuum]ORV40764.1 3-oxoacyl-ACP reductase [Mycobacterium conspicuum]BBZ38960.1 3-oxoacyl-ACP reductase [Mycobacterium conspicuum]
MDLQLFGKTAVVTGASKGIGLAVTEALVAAGAHVVAGSRTPGKQLPRLEEGGRVSFVSVDLTRPGAAEELIAAAARRGGIDVLINNVGGATPRRPGLAGISDDEWRASWELNLMGVVRPTRAALPEIERRGGGSIVMVSSINAYLPTPNAYDYCAAKAAVAAFAKALSKDLAPKNIRVNSVSPGPVSTERWIRPGGAADGFAAMRGRTGEEHRAKLARTAATGRFTTPEEVADLVVFLASDRAGNITGSDYRDDGGYVATI